MKDVRNPRQYEALSIPPSYRALARDSLADAEQAFAAFKKVTNPKNLPPQEQEAWDLNRQAYRRHAHAAVVFAALAVEAFLNTYGVLLMGEQHYLSTFERLKPIEKLNVLTLAAAQKLVEPSDDMAQALTLVFKSRNEVAHPKTREHAYTDLPAVAMKERRQPSDVQHAKNSVRAMTLFFQEFIEIDHRATPFAADWTPDGVPIRKAKKQGK